MKILVTGGAGFIGTNLCLQLLRKGHFIDCIDNESTGNYDNIRSCVDNSAFTYIKGSINSTTLNNEYDIIYNLACPTSPSYVKKFPAKVISAANGVNNLIQIAKKSKAKLIHLSSIKVLENCDVYSSTKKYVEQLIQSNYENSIIIRLSSVYGPNMLDSDSRVIPQFIMNSLLGNPIIIWGDGSQLDSFAYVDDIVHFLINCQKYTNGLYTVGCRELVSIKFLANRIIELSNSKSSIFYHADFKSTRNVDYINHIDSSYSPLWSLTEGLINTIDHFKNRYC